MSSAELTAEQKEALKAEASEYDFLRFSFADLNGIPRGKLVPAKSVPGLIDGLSIYSGAVGFGHRAEDVRYKEVIQARYGNSVLTPVSSNVKPLAWAGDGDKFKVGLITCEPQWLHAKVPVPAGPRFVARKQLEKLDAMGYTFLSACEYEFQLVDGDTGKPVFEGSDIFSDQVLFHQESFLMEVQQSLSQAGVEITEMHTEYSSGQFELVMRPEWGITAGDVAHLYKEGIKEIAHKRGMRAIFMSVPDFGVSANSCHFNHSLWVKDGCDNEKKNAFADCGGKFGFSKTAEYWLGGLIRHAGALSALCANTVNCYRRYHLDWTPSVADWGIEDRMCSFRAKNTGSGAGTGLSTYFECRLPGGAANSYLVMAGVIAAGIDGINNQIECPPPNDKNAAPMCKTLEEALALLEADSYMVEALGPDFVSWLCQLRREVDLTKLKGWDGAVEDKDMMAKERKQYLLFA